MIYNSNEEGLVEFMEMCLVEKEYQTMHKVLQQSKDTFSQYKHYDNLLVQHLQEEYLSEIHL